MSVRIFRCNSEYIYRDTPKDRISPTVERLSRRQKSEHPRSLALTLHSVFLSWVGTRAKVARSLARRRLSALDAGEAELTTKASEKRGAAEKEKQSKEIEASKKNEARTGRLPRSKPRPGEPKR